MSISGQNLTIIIVTLKSENIIDQCLKSIDQNIPVIVIENSNNQKFKEVLDELVARQDNTVRHRVEYAQSYLELENYDTSLSILKELYSGYNSIEAKILSVGREQKKVDKK